MQVEPSDERDGCWEIDEPPFRAYRFRPPHLATETHDLTGADVEEAIRWARDAAGTEMLFSIALVTTSRGATAGGTAGRAGPRETGPDQQFRGGGSGI